MEKVIIALGSNLGKRLNYMQEAVNFLAGLSQTPILKSSLWESEAIGDAVYSFLNGVSNIETSLGPKELLKKLKKFEIEHGRNRKTGKWKPRTIDLDIIAYGELVIHEEGLIIPHPEMEKRKFVLLPLDEIEPQWKHPVTGQSIKQLIANAPDLKIEKKNFDW